MSYHTSQLFHQQEALARDIAAALQDSEHLQKYVICCRKYGPEVIRKAFADAQTIPQERIRKSRAAIFFYFVKHYARTIPNHSRH